MAKINEKKTETVEKTVQQSPDLTAVLDRLDRLEKENKELKEGKENMFVKAKKRNTDPRQFSYKLWGGVPVCNYKSIRKDPTKDLHYKNENGVFVSNHYLEIVLANNKIYDVEVNEFNKSHTRSDKMIAYDENGNHIMIGDKPRNYTFKDTEHGTFTVEKKAIN